MRDGGITYFFSSDPKKLQKYVSWQKHHLVCTLVLENRASIITSTTYKREGEKSEARIEL